MNNIYSIFYEKQPVSIEEMLPNKENPLLCTFLNPYTAYMAKKESNLYNRFDVIGSDGFLVVLINYLFSCKKTLRVSFDMTSLADVLFTYLETHKQSVYFIGSTEENISRSMIIIQNSFSFLNIVGYHHGFINGQESLIANEIIDINPDVVVVGMGALVQDRFAVLLRDLGCRSSIYTCGGFLHQTINRINYYPKWINRLHLRTLYRLIKEPYVWKRVILYYPRFVCKYIYYLYHL